MSGNIIMVGGSIYAGIFEDEVRETEKPACLVEFDSMDELRDFIKTRSLSGAKLMGSEAEQDK